VTDDEYREYLTSLARIHLRPFRIFRRHPEFDELRFAIDQMSSTARFARVVSDRSDSPELVSALSKELDRWPVASVIRTMQESGVLSALDQTPDITFGELRRDVIPEEDVRLLQEAGVADPEAEVTILIDYARRRLGHAEAKPSEVVERAPDELKRAAERLSSLSENSSRNEVQVKKKKLFNGIGKILAGAVAGAGNLLLATGTIIAPNPATAYGVIGSSAIAVGSICQGIGDLRGE